MWYFRAVACSPARASTLDRASVSRTSIGGSLRLAVFDPMQPVEIANNRQKPSWGICETRVDSEFLVVSAAFILAGRCTDVCLLASKSVRQRYLPPGHS